MIPVEAVPQKSLTAENKEIVFFIVCEFFAPVLLQECRGFFLPRLGAGCLADDVGGQKIPDTVGDE